MSAVGTEGNGGKGDVTRSPDEQAWIDRAGKPEIGDVFTRDNRILTVVLVGKEIVMRHDAPLRKVSDMQAFSPSEYPRLAANSMKKGALFYPFGNGFDREAFISDVMKGVRA